MGEALACRAERQPCFFRERKTLSISSPSKSPCQRESRICREFTAIRGKTAKGQVKLPLLKSVFVDFQGSNFRFQSRGRKAELGGGTR